MTAFGAHIDRCYHEGFWVELGDVLERAHATRYTTRGAVVRDIPTISDVAVQTTPYRKSVGLQTSPERSRTRSRSRSRSPLRREDNWEILSTFSIMVCSPTATDVGQTTPTTRRRGRKRCWCCGSTKARKCPRRGQEPVCYGCGEKGISVRTCPRCGADWRRQGAFVIGKGHPYRHRAEKRSHDSSGSQSRKRSSCR